MSNQYHFQLVFLRLLLKRNALSDSKLRITLMENSSTLSLNAPSLQTEELPIKKNQKIVDLDALKTFRFNINRQTFAGSYVIRYEIKGTSEERLRTIPINTDKMMEEYQKSKKVVFQQSFGGQNAEISYKFYLTKGDNNHSSQQDNDLQGGDRTKRSNSISRSKRPPSLNISKRTPSPIKSEPIEQPTKPIFGNFPLNNQESLLTMSPMTANLKLLEPTLNNAESREEYAVPVVQKKQSSLPLSDIEKVKELLETHHRTQETPHFHHVSLKLKTVIAMLVIGIAFLLFDTLSDRKIRRAAKKAQEHSHNSHGSHQEEEGHRSSKKTKKRPSNTHHKM